MSFADYFAMADFNQDGSVQLDEWMVVTERLTVSYKFIYRKNVFYTVGLEIYQNFASKFSK